MRHLCFILALVWGGLPAALAGDMQLARDDASSYFLNSDAYSPAEDHASEATGPHASALGSADKPALFEVETVGRVVFTEDRPADELRRMALSEALYLAALHGAADIRGFSAVDHETNLQEHVVVQPRGHVVDYTILEEGKLGNHYQIRIRSVIGNTDTAAAAQCHRQAPRKITVFKPKIFVDPNLPAWILPAVSKSLGKIIRDMQGHSKIELNFATGTDLNVDQLRAQSADLTYSSLMSATRIAAGDYAMVPELTITAIRERRLGVADVSSAQLSLRLALYEGPQLNAIRGQDDTMDALDGVAHRSVIRLHSFWDNMDVLLNRHHDQEIMALVAELGDTSLRTVDGLACQPLQSQLAQRGDDIYVPIGRKHGIENRQLGIIPAQDGGWVVARVTRLEADRAVLEPLDMRKSLSSFVGDNIRFMETH